MARRAGYGHGRRWPIFFARTMLDNKNMRQADMLKMCCEDGRPITGKCWIGATVCWGMAHSTRDECDAPSTMRKQHPSRWTCDGRGKPGRPENGQLQRQA